MKLLFAGTPDVAVPTLTALVDDPHHEVVAVLTRPDAAVGRHRTPRPCPIAKAAEDLGIRVIKATSVKSGEGHDAVAALDAAVLYTLAVAEVHRLPTDDVERRRALVLGVVMGAGGTALMRTSCSVRRPTRFGS